MGFVPKEMQTLFSADQICNIQCLFDHVFWKYSGLRCTTIHITSWIFWKQESVTYCLDQVFLERKF